MTTTPDPDRARELIQQPGIVWHQRFALAPGVDAPGVNDIGWIAQKVGFPDDLTGQSVLDIGTTNGGAAFMAEARGATSVVATDIVSQSRFGFDRIAELLDSRVRFVESSVYELPEELGGQTFDLVIFWGVLYHLRHPLLGLDSVRRVTHGTVLIESAVCDSVLTQVGDQPVVLCDADPWLRRSDATVSRCDLRRPFSSSRWLRRPVRRPRRRCRLPSRSRRIALGASRPCPGSMS
jgi:SAM-dependent methyltransferase